MSGEVTNSSSDLALSSVIKPNQADQECCICLTIKDITIVFHCQHHLCLPCFKQYAISQLNSRRFHYDPNVGYTLGCPCGCSDTLLQELHVFRLMDKSNYERYKTFAAEEYVFYHHGTLCPMPSCGCGLIIDENNCKVLCPLPIGCGNAFCRSCKAVWTDETLRVCPCQSDARQEEDRPYSFWNQLFGYYVRNPGIEKIKKCPSCRVNTEKDGGCNAIACTQCGMTWCWICEMEFRTDCIQSHWF